MREVPRECFDEMMSNSASKTSVVTDVHEAATKAAGGETVPTLASLLWRWDALGWLNASRLTISHLPRPAILEDSMSDARHHRFRHLNAALDTSLNDWIKTIEKSAYDISILSYRVITYVLYMIISVMHTCL
jgi:hypothetical protein